MARIFILLYNLCNLSDASYYLLIERLTIKCCACRRTKRTINDISEERLANLVTKVNAVFEHLAPLPAEHLSHPVIVSEAESGAAARDNG